MPLCRKPKKSVEISVTVISCDATILHFHIFIYITCCPYFQISDVKLESYLVNTQTLYKISGFITIGIYITLRESHM